MSETFRDDLLPPSPTIHSHPYFVGVPALTIQINEFMCGRLMEEDLGLSPRDIERTNIIVSPATLDGFNPDLSARFESRDRRLFLMPALIWNRQQRLRGMATLLACGSADSMYISSDGRDVSVSHASSKPNPTDEERAIIADELEGSLEGLVGKDRTKNFFRYLYEQEDLGAVTNLLRERSERALVESLAYGLYQVAHPIDRLNGLERVTASFGPSLLSALVIYTAMSLPDSISTNKVSLSLLFAAVIPRIHSYLTRALPRLLREYSYHNIQARRFAKSIGQNPEWKDMVVTENGWD